MAKQTFTTGQVLTAAQMTSLQQTAMGGGAATAKTANYVLVAADAGTTVIMNAAGATTITVNTALFAAGDTVNIQNIGAGICTVTAGTATVDTAGSLALNQYEGGVLYFRSASAATFFDYVQAGSTAPSYSLLGTGTTTSGSTVTVSGISGVNTIYILLQGVSSNSSASPQVNLRINADSGSNYNAQGIENLYANTYGANDFNLRDGSGATSIKLANFSNNAASIMRGGIFITGCNSSGLKMITTIIGSDQAGGANHRQMFTIGAYSGTSTVSSVSLIVTAGSFDAGDYLVYGSI